MTSVSVGAARLRSEQGRERLRAGEGLRRGLESEQRRGRLAVQLQPLREINKQERQVITNFEVTCNCTQKRRREASRSGSRGASVSSRGELVRVLSPAGGQSVERPDQQSWLA